jgi:hypothetical protein
MVQRYFPYVRSWASLRAHYPEVAERLNREARVTGNKNGTLAFYTEDVERVWAEIRMNGLADSG